MILMLVQYIIFAVFNACFIPIIYFFLVETRKRSLEELVSTATCPEQTLYANIMAQDVIFAAGGDPVKKEKTMPYNIPIEEARRILGLSESRIAEVIEHSEKMSE
jgi:hypothetical protein